MTMGARYIPSEGRDAKRYPSFPQSLAALNRSPCVKRVNAPSRVTESWTTLVIGMLIFLACLPLASVAEDETTTLTQLEQSKESNRGFDFTTARFLYGRCTKESYAKGSDYHYNVKVVVAKLVEEVDLEVEVWEDASDFYDNLDTVYGLAGCADLSPKDCRLCLSHIVTHLDDWCPRYAMKAEIMLDTCFLRYDNYYIRFPNSLGGAVLSI